MWDSQYGRNSASPYCALIVFKTYYIIHECSYIVCHIPLRIFVMKSKMFFKAPYCQLSSSFKSLASVLESCVTLITKITRCFTKIVLLCEINCVFIISKIKIIEFYQFWVKRLFRQHLRRLMNDKVRPSCYASPGSTL